MRATAAPPLKMENLLNEFWSLLMTRNIQQYRLDIMGVTTSFGFRCTWYKRWLPLGMHRRYFCQNPHNCLGDGRRGNYRGFLLADDDEYIFNYFCIRCRLDEEVRWLIDVFGFDHGF